jgi:DHA1 family bicyclomycin/chloramphenicol resistance-like MFS transporter
VVLVILAGTYFFLPESKKPDPNFSLKPGPIIKNFTAIIRHPHFTTYALTGAISYAGLYAYIGGSPYVFMELYKVSEAQFGWIFAIIAMGLIGASQVNNLALKYYGSEHIIKVASCCQCIIGITFVCLTLLGLINLFSSVFLVFLFLGCQGFIFPNATALALAPLGHNAGNASALIGAIQMTIGGTASAVISVLQNYTALPMAGVMTCCAIVAFSVFMLGKKIITQRATLEELKKADVEMIGTL